MPSDAAILADIQQAFAHCPRPAHFTDYTHCEECRDHDKSLLACDRATLSLEVVGNPGWDPICFVSPEGFAYYFPALARLALEPPTDSEDWYVPQLLFHLLYKEAFWQHCSPTQRAAVAALIQHLIETRAEFLDYYLCEEEVLMAWDFWSNISGF